MPDNNRRNWVARSTIMRKGGVHDKTNKAKRKNEKQALKKKIRAESFGSFLSKSAILMNPTQINFFEKENDSKKNQVKRSKDHDY